MSIQIRPYVPEDYPMLASWWSAHKWEAVPEAILPGLGVVAYHREKAGETEAFPLCAAFLYMSNSNGVCWMEWLVSNPKAQGMETIRAINAVVTFMEQEAKRLGYGVMLTACRQESLGRIYQKIGFQVTDRNVTHMIKIIGGE